MLQKVEKAIGVTIFNKEKLPYFYLDGVANAKGYLLAATGPELEAGEYRISIYGKENLPQLYIQTKTKNVDWITLVGCNYLSLNKTYSFTLKENSSIRLGFLLGEIGTVYNKAEYKIDVLKVK